MWRHWKLAFQIFPSYTCTCQDVSSCWKKVDWQNNNYLTQSYLPTFGNQKWGHFDHCSNTFQPFSYTQWKGEDSSPSIVHWTPHQIYTSHSYIRFGIAEKRPGKILILWQEYQPAETQKNRDDFWRFWKSKSGRLADMLKWLKCCDSISVSYANSSAMPTDNCPSLTNHYPILQVSFSLTYQVSCPCAQFHSCERTPRRERSQQSTSFRKDETRLG